MKPTMIKKIKQFTIGVIAFSIFVGGAFVYGTFNPNHMVKSEMKQDLEMKQAMWAKDLGLHAPNMNYADDVQFIQALNKCVDFINFQTPPDMRVPIDMITGQAVLESAWGKSRFALQANNLFGIRTFSKDTPHLLPEGMKKWPGWGVRVFETKCDSVKEYIRLLNYHHAYVDFREYRTAMLKDNKEVNPKVAITKIKAFSTTEDYDKRVIRIMGEIDDVMQGKNDDFEITLKKKPIIPEPKPEELK